MTIVAERIEIIDCEQQSPEWWAAKMGVPSASDFRKVLAGGEGKTRDDYMKMLMGEIVYGYRRAEFRNADMDRGNMMEPYLRNQYAMMSDVDPLQVGFVKRKLKVGCAGYSPDSFVGTDGLLEIKTTKPEILHDIMKAGRIPPEHIPQCQGGMWLTDRAWVDVVIGLEPTPGYVGSKLFIRRMRRDEAIIKRIEIAVEVFNEELLEMVEWMRKWQ